MLLNENLFIEFFKNDKMFLIDFIRILSIN